MLRGCCVCARKAARAVAMGVRPAHGASAFLFIGAHTEKRKKGTATTKTNNITAYNVVNKSFSFILAVTRALAILLLNTNGKSTVHMRGRGAMVMVWFATTNG